MTFERARAAVAGVLIGMAGLLWSRKAQASAAPVGELAYPDPIGWLDSAPVYESVPVIDRESANLAAFLAMIRAGEGTAGPNGYRTLVGGGLFYGYADHPRQSVYLPSLGIHSTAAGAYQFLARTWDSIRGNLPDFSPASQDAAAVALIKRRGAYADVLAGRLALALEKCSWEWASLPPFRYSGQGTLSAGRASQIYADAGGHIA